MGDFHIFMSNDDFFGDMDQNFNNITTQDNTWGGPSNDPPFETNNYSDDEEDEEEDEEIRKAHEQKMKDERDKDEHIKRKEAEEIVKKKERAEEWIEEFKGGRADRIKATKARNRRTAEGE